jgi:hypothetical protein
MKQLHILAIIATLIVLAIQFQPDRSGCGQISGQTVSAGDPTLLATDGVCTDIIFGWPLRAARYDKEITEVGETKKIVFEPTLILIGSVVVDIFCILLPYGVFAYYEKTKYGGGPSRFKFD